MWCLHTQRLSTAILGSSLCKAGPSFVQNLTLLGPKDPSCSLCPWCDPQTPQGWQDVGLNFSPFFQMQWPRRLCPISSSRK